MFPRVLFPTDFSEEAVSAVEDILASSPSRPGELILLHVIDSKLLEAVVEATRDAYGSEARARDAAFATLKADAERKMRKVYERMVKHAQTVLTEVRIGKPAEEIVESAEEHDVNLILMPSRSTVGLKSLVFGSVTLGVLGLTARPVLVVKLRG